MIRVIPCLDVNAGRVVKGVNFVGLRDAGDPVELAARYDREGADELVFLDITASHEERGTIVELARRTAEQVFIPFTIGGGLRSEEDIRAVLAAGADKVSLNSAAVRDPALIERASARFGAQCVVVAIDAKRREDGSGWEVFLNGGRLPTGREAVAWAARGRRARGGGAAGHEHGPRRHPGRLRRRAARGRGRCGARPRDRLRGRRAPGALRRGGVARGGPTRCSPPRSSTTASTRSPRSRRRWPAPASRSAVGCAP